MVGHAADSTAHIDSGHSEIVASAASCFAAATAAAVLIALSWFNAVHSPVFDCVRAGAYLLRSRRGAAVPLLQVSQPGSSYGANVTFTSRLSARP
jgi:hypothetical protein